MVRLNRSAREYWAIIRIMRYIGTYLHVFFSLYRQFLLEYLTQLIKQNIVYRMLPTHTRVLHTAVWYIPVMLAKYIDVTIVALHYDVIPLCHMRIFDDSGAVSSRCFSSLFRCKINELRWSLVRLDDILPLFNIGLITLSPANYIIIFNNNI